ncbi:MAG: spore germination protein [Thermoanaerobacteraceae bacterium]|nr:spore germination protein [Thermoanaerobacteraceae bacterium]
MSPFCKKIARKSLFIFTAVFLAFVILSGCWDYRDIDKRLFVGGVGIDKSQQPGRYNISFMIPIVRAIAGGEGGGSGGGGGGGGNQKPVEVESTVADSITDGARNLALRLNRDLSFEHMRVVVIGEDVAKSGVEPVINPFMRQMEFNRRSRIAIAEGEARKVMEIQPWVEKFPALYLESLFGNESLSGKFIDGDLGDFLHQIHDFNGNALVSKISSGSKEVNIGGGAVLKHFKLAGWLTEEEARGINFFQGKITGGNITIDDPEGKGKVTFIILRAHRQLQLTADGPAPEFRLKVCVEGNISDTTEGVSLNIHNEEVIEDLVSKEVKSEILKGISRLQQDYRVDVLKLGEYLHKYHPKLWKDYKDRWEDIFPDVMISVAVTTKVKNIGVTK